MNKISISFVSLVALFLMSSAGIVLAQNEPTAIAPEETITMSDLGVSDPGVLPTSPFYFLKEMGRGLQNLVTFNPIAKAELELKFANEKAAEVKKIAEIQPQNTVAIQKALENYQGSQEKLLQRFKKISDTSQNPEVNTLLNNLTDKVIKHEKLFDEIALKFKDRGGVSKAANDTMAGSENIIGEASKNDDAAKFSSRLEKVLLEEKGGDLKNIRSVEIIDRLSNKTTAATQESLGRLREEFSKKSEQDIQNLVDKKGGDALGDAISNAPGDMTAKSVIIEEIQRRSAENLSQSIGKTIDRLQTSINKETHINEKAKEQIKHAEEIIQELEKKISESTTANISASISTLLAEAKNHLAKAKTSFDEENYGEAFGQARSAEVLARNALKFFKEDEKPETEDSSQRLKDLEEKINTYKNLLEKQGFTAENNKDAYGLLNNTVTHLGYAKESFAAGDLENTKLHMSHARDFLSRLSRILEGKLPTVSIKAEPVRQTGKISASQAAPAAVNCEIITKNIVALKELLSSKRIDESDFKTKYDEHIRKLIACQEEKNAVAPLPPTVSPEPASPNKTACAIDKECESEIVTQKSCGQIRCFRYEPACGTNGKTYSCGEADALSCGVKVAYSGECKSKTETEKSESISEPIEPTNSTGTVKPTE